MHTRRAVTIALATAPLAVTTAHASTPDPVFAAIEAHRAAVALSHAMGATDYDEDDFNALVMTEVDRLAELVELTPTTPAGCAAMLRYVEDYATRDDNTDSPLFVDFYEPVSEPAATLLGRIAAVLEQAGT